MFVVLPSATFCAVRHEKPTFEEAATLAYQLMVKGSSHVRINEEITLPGYPDTLSVTPKGYFLWDTGRIRWQAYDAPSSAQAIRGNDVRGYRGKEVSVR